MQNRIRSACRFRIACLYLAATLLIGAGASAIHAQLQPAVKPDPGIELIGQVQIPGTARDRSGLTDIIADKTPHDLLGSFGSSFDYTGKDDLYIAFNDRGPFDGASSFKDRYQLIRITINPGQPEPVGFECVKTVLLTNENGQYLIGADHAFAPDNSDEGLRYDPEGVRILPDGNLLVCDEYGPFIHVFSPEGRRLRRIEIPRLFEIDKPAADKKTETNQNTRGRVTNKGFEGLALSPDGTKAYAVLQAPLIQDGGRSGRFVRLLEVELSTGRTRQFAIQRPDNNAEYNEILAIDQSRFLLIERDGTAGEKSRKKLIVIADISNASDVSSLQTLHDKPLPPATRTVSTRPVINLLNPAYGLAGKNFPEKVEALTFGPTLPDGRRTLLVGTDNDMDPSEPTFIWVFAVQPF
jgi:hypothetical protein